MAFIFPIYFVPRGLHFNQNYTKHMNWICKLGTLKVFDFNNNNTQKVLGQRFQHQSMFISSLLFHQAEASSLNQPPPQLQLKNPSRKRASPLKTRRTYTEDSCRANKALFNGVLEALQEENPTLLFCFGIPPPPAAQFGPCLRAAAAAARLLTASEFRPNQQIHQHSIRRRR